jgi:hypothetical protein
MHPTPLEGAAPPAPVRPYDTDLGRFVADYPEFRHFAVGPGRGARTEVDGRLVGDMITALSLDELAAAPDTCRHRLAGM